MEKQLTRSSDITDTGTQGNRDERSREMARDWDGSGQEPSTGNIRVVTQGIRRSTQLVTLRGRPLISHFPLSLEEGGTVSVV